MEASTSRTSRRASCTACTHRVASTSFGTILPRRTALRSTGQVTCWQLRPRVSASSESTAAGAVAVVAAQAAAGQTFLRPNDLIVDRRGGIYVTDPGRIGRKGKAFVYYVRPDGHVLLVSDDIRFPNGLTLTRDEKVLLVADSRDNTIFAFDIQNDGNAINKRPFAHLQGIPEGKFSFADGMALDSANRLYVATLTGIQVFDAGGTYLGTIRVPRQPTNLAFSGPDKRTLYITAREGLYRLIMLSQGPDRLGK